MGYKLSTGIIQFFLIFLIIHPASVSATSSWDIDVGKIAEYSISTRGTPIDALEPYYPDEADTITMELQEAGEVELKQWWLSSLQLQHVSQYSYIVDVEGETFNSDESVVEIPFFFPTRMDISAGDFSNDSIKSFTQHVDNDFVGEWGYKYKLNLNGTDTYNIDVVFDIRYNSIASLMISSLDDTQEIHLIYTGQGNGSIDFRVIAIILGSILVGGGLIASVVIALYSWKKMKS